MNELNMWTYDQNPFRFRVADTEVVIHIGHPDQPPSDRPGPNPAPRTPLRPVIKGIRDAPSAPPPPDEPQPGPVVIVDAHGIVLGPIDTTPVTQDLAARFRPDLGPSVQVFTEQFSSSPGTSSSPYFVQVEGIDEPFDVGGVLGGLLNASRSDISVDMVQHDRSDDFG